MGRWQTVTKQNVVVLLIAAVIIVFGYGYYFNTSNQSNYEPVAPVEQADGTIHYTLYHLNRNQKPFKYEPWVLAIPKDIYIFRPEELNELADDIGTIQVNGISLNAGSRPNHSLSLLVKLPELNFYSRIHDGEPEASLLEESGKVIRISFEGWLNLPSISKFQNFGCVISHELFPGIYKLRDARPGEITDDAGSYNYAGKQGCFGDSDDDYYAVITPQHGYVGYFSCNEGNSCGSVLRKKYSFAFTFVHKNIKYLPQIYDLASEFVDAATLKLPSSLETK